MLFCQNMIEDHQNACQFGDFCFCKIYRRPPAPPALMISYSFEAKKQGENEPTKRAHAGFEPFNLKFLQKLSYFL